LPFYVVGNATASILGSVQDICDDSRFVPKDIHAKSGTSERLARFILEDLTKTEIPKATMLYLTGDKNKDTLLGALAEGGITLTSSQVYETPRPLSVISRTRSGQLYQVNGAPVIPYL
jgi:uroporphyrinogen-III synthase